LLIVASAAIAQEDHSRHGGAVAGLGTVNFSSSCNAAAQTQLSRGVALLHSFGYEEARLAFDGALQADPHCAIAAWGTARSWYHPVWPPPTPDDLKQGSAALARALGMEARTTRERGYIDTLAVFYKDWQTVDHQTRARAYEHALARLCAQYPEDDEAAIFHALQIVAIGYLDPTDHTYAWQKKGAEILNRLLPTHPEHPGLAHYIIHAMDYPPTAELGLKAARAYAKIAPESSHAQHMPSHIFTRLGLWDESIASNIAAAKSGVAQAQRLHGGGGSFDQLHALDYLEYAYLQQAKDRSARQVLQEMASIAQLDENQFAAAYAFAASPARWALERHDWKAAAALEAKPDWFPWSRFRNVEAIIWYARAIGAARVGDLTTARMAGEQIAAISRELPAARDYDWSGSIRTQWEAATALIAYAEGRKSQGIEMLRAAAEHEDNIDKHPVTPGALLPVREILADLLMETGDVAGALHEYEVVLKSAPRRFRATAGAAKAAHSAGDQVKARAYALALLEIAREAEAPRPELAWARSLLK
jgi:tetratricopeptide (TPR) repeat protein